MVHVGSGFFFLTNASCLIFITSYLNQGSCHSWLSGSIKVSQRLWIIMIHVYWFGQIITLSYLARICKKRNIITNKNLGGTNVDSSTTGIIWKENFIISVPYSLHALMNLFLVNFPFHTLINKKSIKLIFEKN